MFYCSVVMLFMHALPLFILVTVVSFVVICCFYCCVKIQFKIRSHNWMCFIIYWNFKSRKTYQKNWKNITWAHFYVFACLFLFFIRYSFVCCSACVVFCRARVFVRVWVCLACDTTGRYLSLNFPKLRTWETNLLQHSTKHVVAMTGFFLIFRTHQSVLLWVSSNLIRVCFPDYNNIY